jgi:hypothetical protein
VKPHDDPPRRNAGDDDLDRALLECLAQIGRSLGPIHDGEFLADDGDGFVDAAAKLDGLVDRLIQQSCGAQDADLDAAVDKATKALVHEGRAPLAVRQSLCGGLPRVHCKPDELAHAVRRALDVCAGDAGNGGEIRIRTERRGDDAVLEVRSNGSGDHVVERALTLRAFVKGCGGSCKVATDDDRGVRLTLSFPFALERR